MSHTISVVPADRGWAVQSDLLPASLDFVGGGQAEAAARRLAQTQAEAGRTTEVRIFLRDGALAGRFIHPARGGDLLRAG